METKEDIEPSTIQRKCGGWMAISPRNCRIKIGVTGESEATVRAEFKQSLYEWVLLLNSR